MEWDVIFPRSSLVADSHIGSDHTPLLLDSGCLAVEAAHGLFLWFLTRLSAYSPPPLPHRFLALWMIGNFVPNILDNF